MDKGLKSFLQRISLIIRETNTNQNNEISSHTHTMATVKKNENKCWQNVENLELLYTVGRNVQYIMQNVQYGGSSEIKN